MPVERITVTAVSDEGDVVVIWGMPADVAGECEPVGFAFQTKGDRGDAVLAERASRLARGNEITVEYEPVAAGWNIARGLLTP